MSLSNNHITYLEFKSNDLVQTKTFYKEVFDWDFTDYGPDYASFTNSGLFGGFERSEKPIVNGALAVLYHKDLNKVISKIENAGGKISKPIFSFPGGQRFHFIDPTGNELAVWSE